MAVFNHRFRKTAQLVLAALDDLSEQRGSSVETISDYIASEFSVPDEDFKQYVGKVIEKGIDFGAIRKFRGKYLLGETLNADISNKGSKLSNSIVTANRNDGKGRRGRRGRGGRKRSRSSRRRSSGKRKRYGKKR